MGSPRSGAALRERHGVLRGHRGALRAAPAHAAQLEPLPALRVAAAWRKRSADLGRSDLGLVVWVWVNKNAARNWTGGFGPCFQLPGQAILIARYGEGNGQHVWKPTFGRRNIRAAWMAAGHMNARGAFFHMPARVGRQSRSDRQNANSSSLRFLQRAQYLYLHVALQPLDRSMCDVRRVHEFG